MNTNEINTLNEVITEANEETMDTVVDIVTEITESTNIVEPINPTTIVSEFDPRTAIVGIGIGAVAGIAAAGLVCNRKKIKTAASKIKRKIFKKGVEDDEIEVIEAEATVVEEDAEDTNK